MNRTEQAYADYLVAMKAAGQILDWKFEPMKLRLAANTTYTPDFLVVLTDLTICLDDTKAADKAGKALVEDDAMVKIKVAAEQFPWFRFRHVVKHRRDGFEFKEIA